MVIDTLSDKQTGCKQPPAGYSAIRLHYRTGSAGSFANWKLCAYTLPVTLRQTLDELPEHWTEHTSRSCEVLRSRSETQPTALSMSNRGYSAAAS